MHDIGILAIILASVFAAALLAEETRLRPVLVSLKAGILCVDGDAKTEIPTCVHI